MSKLQKSTGKPMLFFLSGLKIRKKHVENQLLQGEPINAVMNPHAMQRDGPMGDGIYCAVRTSTPMRC